MPKRLTLFEMVAILFAVCGLYGLLYFTGVIQIPFSLFALSYSGCVMVIIVFVLVVKFIR